MDMILKHETCEVHLTPTNEHDRRLLVRLAQVIINGGTITLETDGKEPMIYDIEKVRNEN